jgi:hypothetical protein
VSVCTDVTVDELADLNLDDVPPCQIMYRNNLPGVPDFQAFHCGKPSVVRVTITCHACKRTNAMFMCRECYADAKKGDLHCSACFMSGDPLPSDFSFREI